MSHLSLDNVRTTLSFQVFMILIVDEKIELKTNASHEKQDFQEVFSGSHYFEALPKNTRIIRQKKTSLVSHEIH